MVKVIVVASDITGETAKDDQKAGKLIIRRGPGIVPGKPKVVDVLPHEMQTLSDAPHMYLVEYRAPGEGSRPITYMVSANSLQELVAPAGKRLTEFLNGMPVFKRGRVPGMRRSRKRR